MKNRLPWIVVGTPLLLAVVAFFYVRASRPATRMTETRNSDPESPAAELRRKFPPPPFAAAAVTSPPPRETSILVPPPVFGRLEVNTIDVTKIRDRSTIDMSSGRPVVLEGGADAEILDRALKEMAEAVKDVTFTAPAGPPTAAAKK